MDRPNSSYIDLVNALSQNITPENRAIILSKLTAINQNLMQQPKQTIDPARPGVLSSRKKDISELQHPSEYGNGNNRIPYQSINFQLPMQREPIPPATRPVQKTRPQQRYVEEFDIDAILDDFSQEKEESMDDKLMRLGSLHSKIINEKKQRNAQR